MVEIYKNQNSKPLELPKLQFYDSKFPTMQLISRKNLRGRKSFNFHTVLHHDAHCTVGPIHEKLSPKNFGKDDVSFESV